jgi:light-regulated signal transduction histidine kinase (bacteriophytochrome)
MRILGNITLLERPLRSVTLVAAVESAIAARKRQLETARYIRDLEHTQHKLSQANADLKQFAFAASHDLQEPLRMVNIFTQLLLKRFGDEPDPEVKEHAEYVRTGVNRMELLLRDLLHYSRSVFDDAALPLSDFDLRLSIQDAIEALQVEINSSRAQLDIGAMPVVRADRTQLSVVFQNLIGNAIKYARENAPPCITISAKSEATHKLICVTDNGIGFDQRYAERIFDLFQRLDNSRVQGTGLGLAICRRIVERYGGQIWAKSELGKGSSFFFTIPG